MAPSTWYYYRWSIYAIVVGFSSDIYNSIVYINLLKFDQKIIKKIDILYLNSIYNLYFMRFSVNSFEKSQKSNFFFFNFSFVGKSKICGGKITILWQLTWLTTVHHIRFSKNHWDFSKNHRSFPKNHRDFPKRQNDFHKTSS